MKKLLVLIIISSLFAPNISFAGRKWNFSRNEVIFDLMGRIKDGYEYGNDIYESNNIPDKAKATVKYIKTAGVDIAAEFTATPVAVACASYMGSTASTGTAISALSGAAATSATLAAIGGPAAAFLGMVGLSVAPAVVGGAIVTGLAGAAAWGINKLTDKWF